MNAHFLAKRNRIKLSTGDKIFNVINYLFFGIFTLICIFPFYYIFINAISGNDMVSQGLITFFPMGIHFDNFVTIMQIPGLLQSAIVSVSRTVVGTCLTVMASAFVGFAFTKNEMWGRKFWYRFVVVTMYFGAGIIPFFIILFSLHLTNNFLVYIIPGIVQPFNIMLVKTYVESTPPALQEAAEIDGAGIFTIFIRIILPIITPILATIAIFCAVGHWNSYMDTVLYISDERLFTLQYRLFQYLQQANNLATQIQSGATDLQTSATKLTAQSIQMTITIVVVFPILCVYPFFQKFFVKGIMIGSVKG